MARKPKLRVVEKFLCDRCDEVIQSPEDGFVIHGNVYVADPSKNGGLIGNNFPESETALASEVQKTVFCVSCFFEALGMTKTKFNENDEDNDVVRRIIRDSERRNKEFQGDNVPF